MLLDNTYTFIPRIKFVLTFDDEVTRTIIVKEKDVITCTYKRNGTQYIITGKVTKIAIKFTSSLGAAATSCYMQIDGSDVYSGQVVYVQPSEVLNIVIVSTSDEIKDVVCSVDNEDQKISLIRKNNETGDFEYSMDGITWTPVVDSAADPTNYENLRNLPKINGTTLKGDKTPANLGLADKTTVDTLSATVNNHATRMDGIEIAMANKQNKLVAGAGIHINDTTNVISTAEAAPEWGEITGNITAQTDLQTALNAKQTIIDAEHKVSSDLIDDTDKTNLFVTAEEKARWNAAHGGMTPGAGIDATKFEQGVVELIHPVTDFEKAYLEDEVFNKIFNVSITTTVAHELSVFDVPGFIVFTLTSFYNGLAVDLNAVPEGWTKTGTGVYTKTVNVDVTGGVNIVYTSGDVDCYYNATKHKVAAAVKVHVYKPAYIVTSSAASIASADVSTLVAQANTVTVSDSDAMVGEFTITGTQNKYAYYILPKYNNVKIEQFAIGIVKAPVNIDDITVLSKNIGDYHYYRTEEAIGTTSLTAVIGG